MARDLYAIEKGLRINGENDVSYAELLSGTAIPDGLGDQALAPMPSLYFRTGTTEIYKKVATNGNAADWELVSNATATIGKWREEVVDVVTDGVVAVGTRDLVASPFSDDQAPLLVAADLVVGHHIISDADGTPTLLEITAIAGDNVTFAAAADPLVAEDSFIVKYYLPDPAGGENRALVNYNGNTIVKLSDVDWSLATGINLSGTYSASAGNVVAGDTIEQAIQKVDGVNDAQDTLLGTAQGATNLGAWTSPVDLLFSATSTVKALFQRVGDLLMQLRGVQVSAITAITTVDSVPHATVKTVKWFVEAFEVATPANRKAYEVLATTNGTDVDDNVSGILKVGSNFNLTNTVDISGANMRLRITSTTGGVTVTVRRMEVVKTVL